MQRSQRGGIGGGIEGLDRHINTLPPGSFASGARR
jgi:hypothetical protein